MTTTSKKTVRTALNKANENELGAVLQRIKLGNMVEPIKVTFTALASAAAQDITTAAAKAAGVIASGMTLEAGEYLPAIGEVVTLRVTAGAAAAGARGVTDVGGTPSTTFATISDNGKTLTFEAAVTAFVLTYIPRAAVDVDSDYAPST